MAFVPESANWEPGIYQFEESDVVQGGPNGIDNLPSKQIANRLLWLKALAESLSNDKLNLSALASQAQATAGTDNATWMSPLRVAQAIAALATVAAASETVAGKVELATNAETVTGTDTVRATHPAGVKAAINAAIANLVNAAPGTLDTLNELAVALGNDPNFAATMAAQLASKQPADATLTALAALATGANKLIYATGADAFALTDLSAFARTLIDDADAATCRTTLGLGDVSTKSVAIDFAAQLTTAGYQKLPSGLIVQWGTYANPSPAANTFYPFSFPIAFPTGVFAVVGAAADDSSPATLGTTVGHVSTAQAKVAWSAGGASRAIRYIAIGY